LLDAKPLCRAVLCKGPECRLAGGQ